MWETVASSIFQMSIMGVRQIANIMSVIKVVSPDGDSVRMNGMYMANFSGECTTGPAWNFSRRFACRAPGHHALYFPSVSQKDAFVARANIFELSMHGQTVRLRIGL